MPSSFYASYPSEKMYLNNLRSGILKKKIKNDNNFDVVLVFII